MATDLLTVEEIQVLAQPPDDPPATTVLMVNEVQVLAQLPDDPSAVTSILTVQETQVLAQQADDSLLLEQVETIEVIEVAGQGPPGPPGGGAGLQLIARTDISGHRAVMATPLGAEHAAPAQAHAVVGVSTHAAVAGDSVRIACDGALTEPSWAWTPGATVFFVADGLLTQAVPTAVSVMPIGTALTPTTILINPLHAVFLGI